MVIVMKKIYLVASLLLSLSTINAFAQSSNSEWTSSKAGSWFQKKEYLKGLSATPHSSIDQVQFAQQYELNKDLLDRPLLI